MTSSSGYWACLVDLCVSCPLAYILLPSPRGSRLSECLGRGYLSVMLQLAPAQRSLVPWNHAPVVQALFRVMIPLAHFPIYFFFLVAVVISV